MSAAKSLGNQIMNSPMAIVDSIVILINCDFPYFFSDNSDANSHDFTDHSVTPVPPEIDSCSSVQKARDRSVSGSII